MLRTHASVAKVGGVSSARRWGRAGLALGSLLVGACVTAGSPSESTDDEEGDDDRVGDVAAPGADAPAGEGVAEGSSAIVGGQPEPGRSAVVAIVYPDPNFGDTLICSGVLITPNIVVTAAHCLHPHTTGYDAKDLQVVFGPAVFAPTARVAVLSGAYSPAWRADDPDGENDIGALRLALAAPVDPIPLGPAPVEGGQVVVVGFGNTSPQDPGRGEKRSGNAIIGQVGASFFHVERAPSTTCTGDSGGASLADVNGAEVLVGIHSRGDCVSELWNERIDAHSNGFLKQFMGEFGGCNADGACAVGCPDPDPDCPCADDGLCGQGCGADEDPDCSPTRDCENLPPDGSDVACCDDGACDDLSGASSGAWGSAGCAVSAAPTVRDERSGARGLALLGLAAVSLASRRRSARGGSSRSDS